MRVFRCYGARSRAASSRRNTYRQVGSARASPLTFSLIASRPRRSYPSLHLSPEQCDREADLCAWKIANCLYGVCYDHDQSLYKRKITLFDLTHTFSHTTESFSTVTCARRSSQTALIRGLSRFCANMRPLDSIHTDALSSKIQSWSTVNCAHKWLQTAPKTRVVTIRVSINVK